MNITCPAAEFIHAIDTVSRALRPRPAKEAFSYILVEANDDGVSASATDGMMYMTANMPNARADENGLCVLDGKLLAEIIRKQPGNEITLTANEKNATIKSGKAKTQMSLKDASDFPDPLPISTKCKGATLPQASLRSCVEYVEFAASTDETRKVLTGILVEITAGRLRAVALDGFRMALRDAPCSYDGEDLKALIPHDSAAELSRLMNQTGDDTVDLRMDDQHLHVWTRECAFSTVLLSGEYIDYNRVIPAERKTAYLIDAKALRNSVERSQIIARSGLKNLIHFHIGEDAVSVSANAAEGSAVEDVACQTQGEPLDIAFDGRLLLDALKMESGEVEVTCNGSVSPAVIRTPGKTDRLQIVLPVRVLEKPA